MLILLVRSALCGRYASYQTPNGSRSSATTTELSRTAKSNEEKTHIISFYAVNDSVQSKFIRNTKNLIIIYDKYSCLPTTNRMKHHYDKNSDALMQLLSFWPKLFSGMCIPSLQARNDKISSSIECIIKSVNQTTSIQKIFGKMKKDPLLKSNVFIDVFFKDMKVFNRYLFGCKDRIRVIIVFYKTAFDYIYELVRGDLTRIISKQGLVLHKNVSKNYFF